MHRGRFNHLRHEREIDGLQQVLQVPASVGGAPIGSTLSTLRKTTYHRTELMQRSPMASAGNRSKRFADSNPANRAPKSTPADGTGKRRVVGTRGIFLPRVAKLAVANNNNNNISNISNISNITSNNNNNMGKSLLTHSKSPFKNKALIAAQQQLPELPQQQQLSSNSSSSNSNSNSSNSELRKIKLAQAFRLPDGQNKSFVYLCKPVKQVRELLMVRPLRHSDNNDNNQQQQQQQQLQPGETETPAVGVDDADRDRDRDAEEDADTDSDLLSSPAAVPLPEPELPADMEHVCLNIPTLQREIKLLQLLGEKLEATLRASNNNNNNNDNSNNSNNNNNSHNNSNDSHNNLVDNSIFYTPRSTLTLDPRSHHDSLLILHSGWRRVEHWAVVWQLARIDCYARGFGCAREYRIETRTLTELKSGDESQWFYMPLAAGGELQRTSFRLLRENPSVLLQQLRPLTPARPFNLLEQDPMFFNSLVGHGEPLEQLQLPRESGGGAVLQPAFSSLPYSHLSVGGHTDPNWSGDELQQQQPDIKASGSDSGPLRPQRTKPKSPRRGHRRPVPPLKLQARELEPRLQAQLLKTVLVGIVQVALFLVLTMAFTYPDVRC